jgi:hypothetical protein
MSDAVTRRASAEIREDIGRTRVGLDFLIEALEGRLSMGTLIDEAMGMLRGRSGSEAPIGSLIRQHPGPAALITAGVVWLAVENRKDAEKPAPTRTKRAAAKKSSSSAPRKAAPRKAAAPRKSTSRRKTAAEE